MEFNRIPYEILIEASKAALKNSKDYQYEANLLLKQQSFGHSKSLAILGIEEFGKSTGYWLLSRYIPNSLAGRINFNPDELLNDLQRNHLTKQSIALIFTILSKFTEVEMSKLKNIIDSKGDAINYSQKEKRFLNFEYYSIDFASFKKWSKEIDILPDLDKEKQSGFYVEINNSKSVNKPWRSLAKEARSMNLLLNKLLASFNGFLY